MTNIYEINDLIDFLEEYQITVKQFMYCLLLYYDKRHSRIEGTEKISRPLSQLYKYYTNIEKFTKSEIQELIDKGFLEQHGDKLKLDMLEVTKKFEEEWLGDNMKIRELIDVYPKKVPNFNHPGKPGIPLCTFKDFDKLKKAYNYNVSNDEMHQRIIEAVKWAKEEEQLNVGIEKFVNSKYWEELLKEHEEGSMDNHKMI